MVATVWLKLANNYNRYSVDEDFRRNSALVDLINSSYHFHKRMLYESRNGIKDYDYMRIRTANRIVSHIETVVNDFQGKDKLIIDSEIIGNKKGSKWYTEFFSTPSYYRARKQAYRVFLENIEK